MVRKPVRSVNAKNTKKGSGVGRRRSVSEPRAEYRLDYSKSRPNRFSERMSRDAVVIVLDPDVAKVFRDSKKVNDLLRATIAAVEKPRRRRAG
jgi:uncharacterized protein (DUF4415 family)